MLFTEERTFSNLGLSPRAGDEHEEFGSTCGIHPCTWETACSLSGLPLFVGKVSSQTSKPIRTSVYSPSSGGHDGPYVLNWRNDMV